MLSPPALYLQLLLYLEISIQMQVSVDTLVPPFPLALPCLSIWLPTHTVVSIFCVVRAVKHQNYYNTNTLDKQAMGG